MSEIDNKEVEERIEAAKKELLEKVEAEKAAMIADLQREREKRQTVEQELAKKNETLTLKSQDNPKEVLELLLKEKEAQEIAESKDDALVEFKNSIREFSTEHDAAGLVFKKFEGELKKFNLDGLKSKEDFKNRFGEVYQFMNRTNGTTNQKVDFYNGNPSGTGTEPKTEGADNLSDAEEKVLKQLGWTKERYFKLKASRPNEVASFIQRYS